jgi:hypothetical protein
MHLRSATAFFIAVALLSKEKILSVYSFCDLVNIEQTIIFESL